MLNPRTPWSSHLDQDRLLALDPSVDLDALAAALTAVLGVCTHQPEATPRLATLGKRFGWIAAPRSTVLQPGPVHSGLCADPEDEAKRLLRRLVRLDTD